MTCSQLIADWRQLGHLIFHSRNIVPQLWQYQIISQTSRSIPANVSQHRLSATDAALGFPRSSHTNELPPSRHSTYVSLIARLPLPHEPKLKR